MTAVTLTVTAAATPARVQAELTVIMPGSRNVVVVLPITDPAASFKNIEANWEEVPRPGQKPILTRVGDKLRTIDLKVTVAAPDGGRLDENNTVEGVLAGLTALAELDSDPTPVALTWGSFDTSQNVTATGYWHFQSVEIDSEMRQPGTNNITRAQVSITLIEASPPPSASGTLPAWAAPPSPPRAISTQIGSSQIRAWVVAAGDTAYSIAAAVYGRPEPGWRNILTANNIANPTQLTVGQALIIP